MPNQTVLKISVITCDGHSGTSSSYMIVVIAYKIVKSYIIYSKMEIYIFLGLGKNYYEVLLAHWKSFISNSIMQKLPQNKLFGKTLIYRGSLKKKNCPLTTHQQRKLCAWQYSHWSEYKNMVTIISSKLIIKKGNNLLFKSFYFVYNTHLNWQNCPMTDKTEICHARKWRFS